MGVSILNCLLFQVILVELNIQPFFNYLWTFGTGYGLEHIVFLPFLKLKVYWICFPGAKYSIEQLFKIL